ncbi:hypothetical protein J6590_078032 [Homalodisca vitripennis]|nr:hypothetical protein J6590_078032 [Homalodisca vitripennis]
MLHHTGHSDMSEPNRIEDLEKKIVDNGFISDRMFKANDCDCRGASAQRTEYTRVPLQSSTVTGYCVVMTL